MTHSSIPAFREFSQSRFEEVFASIADILTSIFIVQKLLYQKSLNSRNDDNRAVVSEATKRAGRQAVTTERIKGCIITDDDNKPNKTEEIEPLC
jgi:hypothetical protein